MNVGQMLDKRKVVKVPVTVGTEAKVQIKVNGKVVDPKTLLAKKSVVPVEQPTKEVISVTERTEEYDKKLRKSNLVRRLKKLSEDKKTVSFLVLTPTSTEGRRVQSVIMAGFEVKETSDGNFIINGRDLEHEVQADLECGMDVTKHVCTSARAKEDCIFRSYRIDRILGHTMTWN